MTGIYGKVITLHETKQIKGQIIYGLCDHNGDIFYVGKTTNPKKRMQAYIGSTYCHNKDVAARIKRLGKCYCIVLELNPENLAESEIKWINYLGNKTLNKLSKLYESWIRYETDAWKGGVGVRCPSDFMIFTVIQATRKKEYPEFDALKKLRAKMNDVDRCAYEVQIYANAHELHQLKMNRWFKSCSANMLKVMQNG